MPLDYRVLRPQRAVLVSATGTVTLSDCDALTVTLLDEPAIEEGMPVLVDTRGVDTDITLRDVLHMATLARMLVKRGMDLVAIAADPGAVLMLARAFEVAARALGVHVEVFDTLEKARIWLRIRDNMGLPADIRITPKAPPSPG
jgi:hypothetical protein